MDNFKINTEGVEAQVVELGSRYLDIPGAYPVKIIGVIGDFSKSKGTPAVEIIYEAKAPEGFMPYEGEFPNSRSLKGETKVKVAVAGPIATVVSWLGDNWMDVTNPNSTIQKLMQIADATGNREKFDYELKQADGSFEGLVTALNNSLAGQKLGILFSRRDNEYVRDNTLRVGKTTEYPYGTFAVPIEDLQDLVKKFNELCEKLIRTDRLPPSERPDTQEEEKETSPDMLDI